VSADARWEELTASPQLPNGHCPILHEATTIHDTSRIRVLPRRAFSRSGVRHAHLAGRASPKPLWYTYNCAREWLPPPWRLCASLRQDWAPNGAGRPISEREPAMLAAHILFHNSHLEYKRAHICSHSVIAALLWGRLRASGEGETACSCPAPLKPLVVVKGRREPSGNPAGLSSPDAQIATCAHP
jgi:hypothetical protein